MTTIYTYSEARQNLSSVMDKAVTDGAVQIKRKDGQVFVLKPIKNQGSPLDIEGIELGLTTTEIIDFIEEGRRYR